MSNIQMSGSHIEDDDNDGDDLEQGRIGSESLSDESVCFSDAEDGSCYSQFYSTAGGSYDEYRFECVLDPEIGRGRLSSAAASDCSVEVMEEIALGVPEIKVHLGKVERDCRICHLGLESNSHESGVAIQLGCSCKDDLGAAHKNCAEAWFKIRGNKTCEICHSVARNVSVPNEAETVEQSQETDNNAGVSGVPISLPPSENRNFCQGHRFLNFLLACMVFAFVISWLFHFNVPSS